jgi:hypothetical protein
LTLFHVLQTAFAVAVVALAIERCRAIFYRQSLEAGAFRSALARLLRAHRYEDARAVISAARPAHAAEAVWAMLDPTIAEEERLIEAGDRIGAAEESATRGLRALRIAASIGSVLGFIGAAIEIRWVFSGDHGLLALQAGLVENIGLGRAALSIAIGVATSTFALGAWGVLRNGARELIADGRRVLATVQDLIDLGADLSSPSGAGLEALREKVHDSGTSVAARGQSARRP